jgi:predicted signal transduction protein with EAL and GGDEF domain
LFAPLHGAYDGFMRATREFLAKVDACIAGSEGAAQRAAILLVATGIPEPRQRWMGPDSQPPLLERALRRLSQCVQDEEGEGTVLPLRADTFGVVLPKLRNGLQAREAAHRILGALACPFRTSIGIALYPADGCDAPTLLRRAAAALADARRGAGPTYCFYLRDLATSAASSSPLL